MESIVVHRPCNAQAGPKSSQDGGAIVRMKRQIIVTTPDVRILVTIRTNGSLTRDEVERVRDQLADRLQDAAAGLIYFRTPRHRVTVR